MDHQEQEKAEELERKLKDLQSELDMYRWRIQQWQTEFNEWKQPLKSGYQEQVTDRSAWTQPEKNRIDFSLEKFIGLRLMHIAGIIVLVTGISIGVRYAVNRQLLSEQMRILLAALAGVVLLVISRRLRKKYRVFSAILFSGSMASLYFTCYAAHAFYSMLPFAPAFALMLALTLFTVINALQYDRQEIAILGMTGAYGIPFLITKDHPDIHLFWLYILVINAGIVYLSFRKKWLLMSRLSMCTTWTIFLGWYLVNQEEKSAIAGSIFMILYYVLFLLDALAFPVRYKAPPGPARQSQILLNNAALFTGIVLLYVVSMDVWKLREAVAAFLLLSLLMLAAGYRLLPEAGGLHRGLWSQLVAAVLFFIALQWDGFTITLSWLLVAAALFGGGIYAKESWLRMMAILVVGLTLLKLIIVDSPDFSPGQKVISYIAVGSSLLLFSFFYQRQKRE